MVGGVLEAIQQFIDTNSLDAVFDVPASIIETYKDDFAKYATQSDLLRLRKVFNYFPMAAGGEKFKYVRVDPEAQSTNYYESLPYGCIRFAAGCYP